MSSNALPFTITPEDMLRDKVLDPGWYPAKVKEVSQEPAKTDGSTNTIVDLTVASGPNAGVPLRRYFSEKAPGFALNFIRSLGVALGPQGGTVDLSKAKGKVVEVYVKNETWEGRLRNSVEDFRAVQQQ